MVAWRRHVNGNEISSASNEDEPFGENIPLAGYGKIRGEIICSLPRRFA